MNEKDEKQQEPIILELDDRLEFSAAVVASGEPTALGLDQTQCQCANVLHCVPDQPILDA